MCPYLYQHTIECQINMTGNKYNWTQKFENVYIFIKCNLQYIYNILHYKIHSAVPSKKTNKLHNEFTTLQKIAQRSAKGNAQRVAQYSS